MFVLKLKMSFFVIVLLCFSTMLHAQPSWTFDPLGKEKKPEKYEEKKLASEKTGEKKFGTIRRIMQNTTSHYNFYFNAHNKIDAVIENAKISNRDDYSMLLSFYPYSLDNTATQKTQLDSVIYKATSGILLHDLRTEWVDNFYLLIGKAYFLKKDFDSAALTFQFINYNLFPRKRKNDDDSKIVGSNNGETGTGSVSIADKEKRNVFQKAFTLPPSRNEALIWLTRTFIEQRQYGDAAGMISILQNDKNLPARLRNDLEEVTSYWFFAQNNFDSAANHLHNALSNADTKQDKSRWEYLLAQLYERNGRFDDASQFYKKASRNTADPVMDIYARLNDAKMMKNTGNIKELDNSIANLLRMAKRDRFEAYKDVIYYSAAQLSLQRPDTATGINYYGKSIVYNTASSGYRDKSYLQLAGISYSQKRYTAAKSFYDSLTLSSKLNAADSTEVEGRKEILSRLVPQILAVEKEDSLQKLAAMPPAERDAIIKKIVKAYKKQNGLKEDDDKFAGKTLITFTDRNTTAPDLFNAAAASKTDFYFYNSSLRAKGFNEFKIKWGKRENLDNWRRKTIGDLQAANSSGRKGLNNGGDIDSKNPDDAVQANGKPVEYSYDALMADIPLTKEKIDTSNTFIAKNLLSIAQIFQNELNDYEKAIEVYDDYVRRFPAGDMLPDIYLGLSFCWQKLGNESKANLYKNTLTKNYASSSAARLVTNPAASNPSKNNSVVAARYEGIYNMFIEGKFEEAFAEKKKEDSTYGKNYWSPQLLFIEAVYFIKEKKDSEAIVVLGNIEKLYPSSALKQKATTLIDVLKRRNEIESYLSALQVTRVVEDDKVIVADDKPNVVVTKTATKAAPAVNVPVTIIKPKADTVKVPEVFINKAFTLQPDKPQYVAMILDKVDGVYVNEAKNAFTRFNKESMATINVVITKDTLDAGKSLLLFSTFEDANKALLYFEKIKRAAPSEVSWLQAAKYSFIIISDNNLQLLKNNKDLAAYKQLLNTNFGNKF